MAANIRNTNLRFNLERIFSEKPGNICRPWTSRNSDPTVR